MDGLQIDLPCGALKENYSTRRNSASLVWANPPYLRKRLTQIRGGQIGHPLFFYNINTCRLNLAPFI